jgi:preprotein translocase subunit SecY
MLAVYRMGAHIPVPGINTTALSRFFEANQNTLFGMFNMFSGKALENASIFALGIMPYISASIIFQLLTVVVPYLNALSKEGELGRKKINQYTRYTTVVLSMVQGFSIASALMSAQNAEFVLFPGMNFKILTVITLATGTAFIMWLGEQISDRGIGNGVSLIIFSGIAAQALAKAQEANRPAAGTSEAAKNTAGGAAQRKSSRRKK